MGDASPSIMTAHRSATTRRAVITAHPMGFARFTLPPVSSTGCFSLTSGVFGFLSEHGHVGCAAVLIIGAILVYGDAVRAHPLLDGGGHGARSAGEGSITMTLRPFLAPALCAPAHPPSLPS